MKALIVERYGADGLALVDRPEPDVGPRDVRIAVAAAGLNPLDYKIRDGKVKMVLAVKPPIALGCDVAGTIDRVGAEVQGFAVGDEVFARLEKDRMGGFAELVVADPSVVAMKPARTSFAEAAAIPLAALTALQALRTCEKAGPRVLVQAGAGGVGSLAIQIAKLLGLHVTTTTSTRNVDFVRELGADEVVDYTKREPLPTGLDAAFDTVGTTELASIGAVRRGGTVVGIAGLPDGAFTRAWLPAVVRPVLWVVTGKRRRAAAKAGVDFVYLFMQPDGAQLAEIGAWIDAGKLRSIVHATYPLADYQAAFAELERGHARGKIVLRVR